MQIRQDVSDIFYRVPALAAVSQALTRFGWRGLAARVYRALASGGPALLRQKIRTHGAVARDAVRRRDGLLPATRRPSAPHRPLARGPSPSDPTYVLEADHGLPLALFAAFMDRWDHHPSVLQVYNGVRDVEPFEYTVVFAPHPANGFAGLADSLALARNLAHRASMTLRVVIHAPAESDAAALPPGVELRDAFVDIIVANTTADLRRLLETGGPRHLAQFLICGDQICPVFAEIAARSSIPDFDLVLMDMYFADAGGNAHLILLPGINPIHALNVDYFLSRSILRAHLAAEEIAKRAELDVYELTVAVLEQCTAPGTSLKAHHIAFPMLRIAETRDAIQQRRAGALARKDRLRLTCARSEAPLCRPRAKPRVSIVICTRDNGFLVEQLVDGLWSRNRRDLADVVVVANRTANPYAAHVHQDLAASGRARLVQYDQAFNFSAQCNIGAAVAGGDLLLFLNDDIVPVNRDWLSELIAPLDHSRVGVVGPLLLYPDQTVQHAGMFLGFNGVAGHTLRGAHLPGSDYCFMASAPRQVMAVTGAALCIRRRDFEALNGFDQNLFALHIQDVDLCLRAHFSGLAVVYTPRSVLLHMESISVKPLLEDPHVANRRAREHAAFLERWGDAPVRDEFHNPNFWPGAEDLRRIISPQA